MIDQLQNTARKLLRQSPGVVIRHKLEQKILCVSSPTLEKYPLDSSQNVQSLASEQHPDGSWGRFHSQNTRIMQKHPTTEFAVERAVNLGLDGNHPILIKATGYIEKVLKQIIPFPDPPEVNNRWETGKRLFLTSTLSLIQPDHPLVVRERALWLEIAKRTFQSGTYCLADEVSAHADFTGASVKGSYLTLNGKYQLNLLGSQPCELPSILIKSMVSWVWDQPDGIGYINQPLNLSPTIKSKAVDRWLSSLELILTRFPVEAKQTQPAIDWLLTQRGEEGCWDFGTRPRSSSYLPLSDHWRNQGRRRLDWTTRVLCLLMRYFHNS